MKRERRWSLARVLMFGAVGVLLVAAAGTGIHRIVAGDGASAPERAVPAATTTDSAAADALTEPGRVVAFTGADVAWEYGPWGDTADVHDGWKLMPRSATHGPLVVHPDGRRTGFAQTDIGACLAEWTFATQLVSAPPAVREILQQQTTLDGAGYTGIGPEQFNRTDSWVPPNDAYLPNVSPAKRPFPVGCLAKPISPLLMRVTMFWRIPGASADSAIQTDWIWQDGTWVLSAPLDGDYLHPTVRVGTSPRLSSYLVEAPQ